jgi:hypothetical protein
VPKHEKTTDVNTCETSKDCIWTSSDVTGSLDIGVFSCVGTPDLCILIAALGAGTDDNTVYAYAFNQTSTMHLFKVVM